VNKLRFIDDPVRVGAVNMALDDTLARFAEEFDPETIFRIYGWLTPTLSLGYHQRSGERVNFENCLRLGVDLARRPTGGRELLHNGDLSFSIVTQSGFEKSEMIGRSREFFFKVGQVITSGLGAFGIKTLIESGSIRHRKVSGAPCLIATSRYEIKADGKKLVPMAQRLYPGSMLVHGSIPLEKSQITTASLLNTDSPDSLQGQIDESSTDLYQLSKRKIDIIALRRELELRFEEVFEGSIKYRSIPETVLTKALASKLKWEINKNSNKTND